MDYKVSWRPDWKITYIRTYMHTTYIHTTYIQANIELVGIQMDPGSVEAPCPSLTRNRVKDRPLGVKKNPSVMPGRRTAPNGEPSTKGWRLFLREKEHDMRREKQACWMLAWESGQRKPMAPSY